MSKSGRLKYAPCHLPAIAMPTLVARPLPSGPVVVSTPEVQRYSGCPARSEEHTSELQSLRHLVCRLLLEKKKTGSVDPNFSRRIRNLSHLNSYNTTCR